MINMMEVNSAVFISCNEYAGYNNKYVIIMSEEFGINHSLAVYKINLDLVNKTQKPQIFCKQNKLCMQLMLRH